jgi:hypothetical protein
MLLMILYISIQPLPNYTRAQEINDIFLQVSSTCLLLSMFLFIRPVKNSFFFFLLSFY